MLCYANTVGTRMATKRETRDGDLHGTEMSHSQPRQAPRWHDLLTEGCTLCPSPCCCRASGEGEVPPGPDPMLGLLPAH